MLASAEEKLAASNEAKRRYAARYPERVKVAKGNVRAARRRAPGSVSAAEWKRILLFYGSRCATCRASAEVRPLTVDHFVPLSRGGANTWDNVWPLCLPCNLSKQTKVPAAPYPPHVGAFRDTGSSDRRTA